MTMSVREIVVLIPKIPKAARELTCVRLISMNLESMYSDISPGSSTKTESLNGVDNMYFICLIRGGC